MARGFWAEINRAAKAAARESEKRQRERDRAHRAAVKEAERARREEGRIAARLSTLREKERKQQEKAAKLLHQERMQKEADALNLGLAATDGELAEILSATLEVDDYVDLESLRETVELPEFDAAGLDVPCVPPDLPELPTAPVYKDPATPTGLRKLIGGKKRHREGVKKAESAHARAVHKWNTAIESAEAERARLLQEHVAEEEAREAALLKARQNFENECAEIESAAAARNNQLDDFIRDLGYGVAPAVSDYVEIVLANSVYPDCFLVESSGEFDASLGELQVETLVPGPGDLSDVKSYRYNKSSDEIVSSALSQKVQKDRYAEAIWQAALRTLHEVFEADRRELIGTISLVVGSEVISPASGNREFVPFVSVGAERENFLRLNLSRVVPAETLKHLGASMSRNPLGLEPAKLKGIR